MVESFVVTELARQLTWLHYRTKDKTEVDAVIETPNGRVIGIEVKPRATARAEDLIGLRSLARHPADRFVAGYVLHTGQQTLPFGERPRAVPLDALWRLSVWRCGGRVRRSRDLFCSHRAQARSRS